MAVQDLSKENAQGWTRITFHKPTFDGRENGGFHTLHAQGVMVGRDPLKTIIAGFPGLWHNILYSLLTMKCARVLVPQPNETRFETITLRIA